MVNPNYSAVSNYFDDTTVREMQSSVQKTLEAAGLNESQNTSQRITTDFLVRKAHGAITKELAENEITILKNELNACGVKESDLQTLAEKIQQIEEIFFPTEPALRSKHAPVSIGLILDIDARDHNGVMITQVRSFSKAGHAFITSLNIFGGFTIDLKHGIDVLNFEEYRRIEKSYDMYISGGFVVCLPKVVEGTTSKEDRLKHFGVNPASVKPVKLKELLEPRLTFPTLVSLQKIFVTDPVHDRVVFVAGHGGVNEPASLSSKDYSIMVKWLETQHCKGLVVFSCFAGGESSALHLPELTSKNEHPVNYPVLLQSIGEFSILGGAVGQGTALFFELSSAVASSKGNIVPLFRKIAEKQVGTDVNLYQVYVPPSRDSPAGFRALGETDSAFPLTYASYQKARVEDAVIKVNNKKFLELYPLKIETRIQCSEQGPIILSMVPGDAYHFLFELVLDTNLRAFINSNVKFHHEEGATKGLFIRSLQCDGQTYEQFFLNLQTGICCYRQGNQYFSWNKAKGLPKPISPFQYFLYGKKVFDDSQPGEKAVRASTGGQQDLSEISNELKDAVFSQDLMSYDEVLTEAHLEKATFAEMKVFSEKHHFTKSDKVELISYLLPHNEKVACELFEDFGISPDECDSDECPLVVSAAFYEKLEFLRVLIRKGVNLNAVSPVDGSTPLIIVLSIRNIPMRDLLLQQESVDLNCVQPNGTPTLAFAMSNEESMQACLRTNKPVDVNISSPDKKTVLGIAVKKSPEVVRRVIAAGADPNLPSEGILPLVHAMIPLQRDAVIDALLESNANPYLEVQGQKAPVVLAIERCPLQVAEKLLKRFNPELDEAKRKEMNKRIFYAALETGQKDRINLALNLDIDFGSPANKVEEPMAHGIRKLLYFGDIEMVRQLIDRGIFTLRSLINMISQPAILSNNIEGCLLMAKTILEAGCNPTEALRWVVNSPLIKFEGTGELIKFLMQNGGDVNASGNGEYATIFSQIVLKCTNSTVAMCLDNGADLFPPEKPEKKSPLNAMLTNYVPLEFILGKIDLKNPKYRNPLPFVLREIGSVEAAKACIKAGFKIEPEEIKKSLSKICNESNKVALLEENGYQFSFSGLDTDQVADIVYEACYRIIKPEYLDKLIGFGVSKEALRKAYNRVYTLFILYNQPAINAYFEEQCGVLDVNSLPIDEFQRLFSPYKTVHRNTIETLEKLHPDKRREVLKANIAATVKSEDLTLLEYAFKNGVSPDEVCEGKALIFLAVETKKPNVVKAVLAAKPKLDIRHEGKKPDEYAESLKLLEISELLGF